MDYDVYVCMVCGQAIKWPCDSDTEPPLHEHTTYDRQPTVYTNAFIRIHLNTDLFDPTCIIVGDA